MGIDIFAESCRFWEDENPDKKIIIMDADVLERLEKLFEGINWDGERDVNEFVKRNLDAMGY